MVGWWRRKEDPDRGRRGQALRHLREGEWEAAAAVFEELLADGRARGEGVAEAAHDLATTYNRLGRNDEAIRLYLEALAHEESEPDSPLLSWTLHGLSAAHLACGEFAVAARRARQALTLAEQAIAANRDHSPATVAAIARVLAKACDGLGDVEGARAVRLRAEALCPTDTTERRAIREALEQLTDAVPPGSTPYRGIVAERSSEGATPAGSGSVRRRLGIVERLRTQVAGADPRMAVPTALAAQELAEAGDRELSERLLRDALVACSDARLSPDELREVMPRLARTCALLGHAEAARTLGRPAAG